MSQTLRNQIEQYIALIYANVNREGVVLYGAA